MKKRFSGKQIVSLLLAAMLLTACGKPATDTDTKTGDTTGDTRDTAAEETTETGPQLEVPSDSLNGYTFRVLTRDTDHHIKEVYAAELTGEVVNDAVYTRNMKVEDA